MIILSASDLCLSFGTDVILEKISLGVGENDKIGVVGVNGAGKSMFLKMLSGRISPTSGEVFTAAGKTVGFLSKEPVKRVLCNGEDVTALVEKKDCLYLLELNGQNAVVEVE